jgi:hypothetical protein
VTQSLLRHVAALYVEAGGAYGNLPGVEVWDEVRDARLYDGPYPVVAHPPCARWSRLAGFTEHRFGLKRGDDGGCFKAALHAVRTYGGVLEHPAYSAAWDAFGLPEPTWRGGWTQGICGGWSCYVEQGRYGLPVKKATWLYAYGVELPELRWGWTPDHAGEPGHRERSKHRPDAWRERFRPTERDRRSGEQAWRSSGHRGPHKGLTSMTPPEFREVLLAMARSVPARPSVVAV